LGDLFIKKLRRRGKKGVPSPSKEEPVVQKKNSPRVKERRENCWPALQGRKYSREERGTNKGGREALKGKIPGGASL